uniref:Homeobox domain-containing protein n=1 Tax=Salix viminalis TaxID=40686 RepID=A0A6N2LW08_SALVM
MEESSEVHSEENIVSPERNLKRTVKTPAQVIALENFYDEHKYPKEEMKSELADQIGLTEKQISSWFCHRRLKDKRLKDEGYTNGRQDRSSSILQDRGSGLRQDSCGSTKQGDYRNIDPREVESQRLYGQDFHTADLTYDRTSRYTGNVSGIDNISSRSSSSLQDKLVSQREDPYDTETSKYLAQNGASMPLIPKGAESFGHKPSGYLKVKGEIENAAITAVKIQLGRHYKENGPPLGVEFQLLPPSAFASPSRDPVNGPIYVGDLGRMHSPDVSGVRKQPGLSGRYEVYSTKMCSHDSYTGGVNCNPKHVSDSHERKSRHHLEQKSTYNGSNSNAGGNSAMDMPDDLAGEMRVYKNKRNYRTSSKHDFEGKRPDSLATHHGPSGRRVNNEKTEAWLHDHDNDNPKIAQRNDYMSKPSHLIHGPGKSLVTEERAPFIMTEKDEKRHGEMKKMKGVKRHPRDETVVAKRFRTDFSQQEHVTKASVPGMHQRTNLTERSVMERPSSFSEDEPAETSSSAE